MCKRYQLRYCKTIFVRHRGRTSFAAPRHIAAPSPPSCAGVLPLLGQPQLAPAVAAQGASATAVHSTAAFPRPLSPSAGENQIERQTLMQ